MSLCFTNVTGTWEAFYLQSFFYLYSQSILTFEMPSIFDFEMKMLFCLNFYQYFMLFRDFTFVNCCNLSRMKLFVFIMLSIEIIQLNMKFIPQSGIILKCNQDMVSFEATIGSSKHQKLSTNWKVQSLCSIRNSSSNIHVNCVKTSNSPLLKSVFLFSATNQ